MQYYDLEKIERFLESELDKIQKNTVEDETIKGIIELKLQITKKIKDLENDKRIILDPLITQQFYKVYGGFMVVPDERKGYYLCLAIKSIMGLDSIKKILQEYYGKNYTKVMDAFNEYFANISEIKNNIDTIREDERVRNNIQHPIMKRHFKLCKNIPMIYEIPFHILGVLFEKTNLSSMKVDKDALRIYEMEYKKPLYTLEQNRQLQKETREGGGEE